ncbi:MAG: hypothetical protein KY445_05160, partial [Armatimonadetes bacterium]|nr:hypothetical protein [Armatimonadota bacterium]
MNEQRFLTALLDLSASKHKGVFILDKEFKEALLAFGSETEDNLSCVEEIEYGELTDGHSVSRGFILKRSGIPLSDA